ncbi:LANO_0H11364g1_1 [Lachancea nothofagi CBS 11611]|uniref:LANO_0H11364g1_1 n=1 Tax=Lachancea nothofagi CBS 11611 TaxID=1266666 RepID=A0A1G4KMA5_9SACH|nr:LANO_0H11364g1_1 [Lachancea nothofagi CBS 11611]
MAQESHRRKRFKLDEPGETTLPLKSKSVNVGAQRAKSQQKRRRVEPESVFDHEHVSIRLADDNWESVAPKNDRVVQAKETRAAVLPSDLAGKQKQSVPPPRRLKIKTTGIEFQEHFLDADRSIQLDDFDQPPDSTSTPLLGSPRSGSTNFEPWVVEEPWGIDDSWLRHELATAPVEPYMRPVWHPGQSYGIPMAPGYVMAHGSAPPGNSSVLLKEYDSPLKQRGIMFYPPVYAGGPSTEAYPWYSVGDTYKSPRAGTVGKKHGGLRSRNSSRSSFKSSGGDATCPSISR